MPKEYPIGIQKAFDEMRFGPSRTLNLRESLPTAEQACARAESWIRAKQVERAGELLVITGRGNGSIDGIGVVRKAILVLFPSLRRRNVITRWEEHTAGSFVVFLAPISAMFESPRRRREQDVSLPVPTTLAALPPETLKLLRELAAASLMVLRVNASDKFIESEMISKFSKLTAAIADAEDPLAELHAAIQRALDELDESE